MVFVFAPPSMAVRVLCTVATGLTMMRTDWSAPRELTNSSLGDTPLIVDCGGEKQTFTVDFRQSGHPWDHAAWPE